MLEFFSMIFQNFWPWLGFTIIVLGVLNTVARIIEALCYAHYEEKE